MIKQEINDGWANYLKILFTYSTDKLGYKKTTYDRANKNCSNIKSNIYHYDKERVMLLNNTVCMLSLHSCRCTKVYTKFKKDVAGESLAYCMIILSLDNSFFLLYVWI